jgi:predicted PurR-regulated permease PerM
MARLISARAGTGKGLPHDTMSTLGKRLEENLGILVLALLALGCMAVVRPFFSATLWAIVLCYASWPLYQRLLRLVKGRATVAALLMTLAMCLVVLLPFVVVGATLADNVTEFTSATKKWLDAGPPGPPAWLEKVPIMGAKLTTYWQETAQDSGTLLKQLKSWVEPVGSWLLKVGLALGRGMIEMALSILIAFFFFRDGPTLAGHLSAVVHRIGGESGRHLLELAGKTTRGVVYGILGTALVQAVMAGAGFLIAGVPGAGLLALLTFFLSVVPMGPPLIWVPAALWLFHQDATGWGIFMLIWGVAVSSVDNVVKPWLISQGSDLPFVLIFFGVLGGALAFGFIGVFLGPTLLAAGFRLIGEWMAVQEEPKPGKTEGAPSA